MNRTDSSGLSYEEVESALNTLCIAKKTMNSTSPDSFKYKQALKSAQDAKQVILKSDIYIENWGELTDILDPIVNSSNNSLESIEYARNATIAARKNSDKQNLADDIIFIATMAAVGVIAIKVGTAILPNKSKYPGNDPTKSPGDGWEWRGSGTPQDGKGSWYNPSTGESLHPDLNHPGPIGPHWDYIPYKNGPTYRWHPDGNILPK